MNSHHNKSKITLENEPIDFVVLWVDGSDPAWRSKKNSYLQHIGNKNVDGSEKRYRDFGLLRYWFRAVESFTPWVNNIYLVTDGQLPEWININAARLRLISHDQFIPGEYLPTFSANPIELNMHRIEGLSERFVYFNDDMYILKPLDSGHFFRNGMPVMSPKVSLTVPKNGVDQHAHMLLNNIMHINKDFKARQSILNHFSKWFNPFILGMKVSFENIFPLILNYFPGIALPHLPAPFLLSTIKTVWEYENEDLYKTTQNRFRSDSDLTQYLFSEWQLASGLFECEKREKLGRYYEIKDDSLMVDDIVEAITKQKHSIICINDVIEDLSDEDYNQVSKQIKDAFEKILPYKSAFEI